MSQVGRDQTRSSVVRPASPTGVLIPAGQELRLVERQRRPFLGLLDLEHPVVEARQLHPSLTIVELAQRPAEHVQGVRHRTAVHARVQIARGPTSFSST
jgi:hypothetical protein